MPGGTALLSPHDITPILVDIGLCKAVPALSPDPWIIYIQASTPAKDFQEEYLPPNVLRAALPYFLRNGKITYEHVTDATRHDPSILIGQPLDATFSRDGAFLIKARLYPYVKKAQDVMDILRSDGQLKASVGGKCSKQLLPNGAKVITGVFLNHIALTSWPVNDDTGAQLTPYAEFLKALDTTSAAPLVPEDLEGDAANDDLFTQRWKSLTAIVHDLAKADGRTIAPATARQIALAVLIRRGDARDARITVLQGG